VYVCVYACYTSSKKKKKCEREKEEPEEDRDAGMGFKRAFHIFLHDPCSSNLVQPTDLYGSLEGGNL